MRIQPFFLWHVMRKTLRVYVYIYIHTYGGQAGGSPEDVGTFSLSLIDICIFCRSCIQMGG